MLINTQLRLVCGLVLTALLSACTGGKGKLPILGNPTVDNGDTVFSTIANFTFTDQDGKIVTNETFKGKVYVADFIFLSCPTICPRMTSAMRSVYEKYEHDEKVGFISYTIDPEKDSIPKLKEYASNLSVASNKWHFVRGDKDSVFHLANNSYFAIAYPDSTASGGFTHSGAILLVDAQRHIRGVYNGLKQEETNRLIGDINVLLKEQK